MDLKIKKINDKLDLDTEAQGLFPGCESDCPIYETVYVVNVTTTGPGAIGIGTCGYVQRFTGSYNASVSDLL